MLGFRKTTEVLQRKNPGNSELKTFRLSIGTWTRLEELQVLSRDVKASFHACVILVPNYRRFLRRLVWGKQPSKISSKSSCFYFLSSKLLNRVILMYRSCMGSKHFGNCSQNPRNNQDALFPAQSIDFDHFHVFTETLVLFGGAEPQPRTQAGTDRRVLTRHVVLERWFLFSRPESHLEGMTTSGSPLLGLHIRTCASLALGRASALGGMGSLLARMSGCSWCARATRLAREPSGMAGSTAMSTRMRHRTVCSRIFSRVTVFSATSHVMKLWSRVTRVSAGAPLSPTGTAHVTLG